MYTKYFYRKIKNRNQKTVYQVFQSEDDNFIKKEFRYKNIKYIEITKEEYYYNINTPIGRTYFEYVWNLDKWTNLEKIRKLEGLSLLKKLADATGLKNYSGKFNHEVYYRYSGENKIHNNSLVLTKEHTEGCWILGKFNRTHHLKVIREFRYK